MTRREKTSVSFRKKILVGGLSFIFVVLVMASFFGKRGLIEVQRAQNKNEALLQEAERLKQEKSKLEKEIRELEENPLAVEEKARDKLWLVRPDEIIVVKTKPKASEKVDNPESHRQ